MHAGGSVGLLVLLASRLIAHLVHDKAHYELLHPYEVLMRLWNTKNISNFIIISMQDNRLLISLYKAIILNDTLKENRIQVCMM